MKCRQLLTLSVLLMIASLGRAQTTSPSIAISPTNDSYLRLAAEIETSLQNDDLKKFFPAAIDPAGGFFENFSQNWTHRTPDTTRSVVYQSRLTWLAAQAAMRYPDLRDPYLAYVRHGAQFLIENQWDKTAGGFWWSVNTDGTPTQPDKHIYGHGFAIYALAAAYQATHDPQDLDFAKQAFQWMESHAHDSINGGYFEQLRADGSHLKPSPTDNPRATDVLGAKPGQKTMNAHIHLLEALTGLLQVWPDDLVKKRTEEVYQIGLTKIYADPGYLHQYFAEDWTPTTSRDSYGHDIETAYLFAEAASALGKPDDPLCWNVGKNIVDHCLAVAYDPQSHSLNSEGSIDGTGQIDKSRVWWVEAESLNALLLMHERFGKSDTRYWNAFTNQWSFIQSHQIDPTNGGWYNTLTPNDTPLRSKLNKTDAWTEGYHQGRTHALGHRTSEKISDSNK